MRHSISYAYSTVHWVYWKTPTSYYPADAYCMLQQGLSYHYLIYPIEIANAENV